MFELNFCISYFLHILANFEINFSFLQLSPTNNIPFEFMNGGNRIENNLINHNVLPPPAIVSGVAELGRNSANMAFSSCSMFTSPESTGIRSKNRSKSCCDVCSKSFNNNRLLKHVQQCHSNVK